MKIAGIDLGDKPLFLAPMEDVTDPSFRYVCKMFGADMVYTEFISCDGLIRDAAKTVAKLRLYDYERPVGIQLYGHQIEPMVEAARVAEAAGPDLIDINFGCPVRKIAGRGAGSGMMRDVPKMVEMARRIVEAVRLPVTVKTRLGWDEDSKNIVEIAERLQDAGIAALTIHGRTRAQMYRGEADWTLIGEVKRNPRMRIPIVGNGDIDSGEKAAEVFERYGVDGVMIGRATYGRPWIFREIRQFLSTGVPMKQPSVRERVELAKLHLAKSLEFKGEKVGVLEMRRHLSCYFKGLPDFKATRLKLVTLTDPGQIVATLVRLGMPDARFEAAVVDCGALTEGGRDRVEFRFSANRTTPPAAVERIASGGELSRVMLALKALLARRMQLPTILFDEIDTGVSGRIADAMGEIICALAETMQVVDITHLPQVASKGSTHFVVYKRDGETHIARLTPDERTTEIAKMLSGSEVTEAAMTQARILLGGK